VSPDQEKRIELDYLCPPTCFTASLNGVEWGIMSYFPRFREQRPYIAAGRTKVVFDRKEPPVYHFKSGRIFVRRADIKLVRPKNGDQPFYVLKAPRDETSSALVHVSTRCNCFETDHLHSWRGLSNEDGLIRSEGEDYLVTLREGQSVTVFFCETASRFIFKDGELIEEPLTEEEEVLAKARAVTHELSQPEYDMLPENIRGNLKNLCTDLNLEVAPST